MADHEGGGDSFAECDGSTPRKIVNVSGECGQRR